MKKLIALALSLTAIVPLTASPAQAAVGGALAFTCTATLPSFPSPGGNGSCSGTASAGGGAGISTGLGYVVTGAGSFSANFSYNEGCAASGLPPAQGTAEGSASVDGLVAVGPGGVKTNASADFEFNWGRAGVVATVSVSGTLTIDGVGTEDFNGTAVAAFLPVLAANNLCPEGGPLTAQVVGAAELGV